VPRVRRTDLLSTQHLRRAAVAAALIAVVPIAVPGCSDQAVRTASPPGGGTAQSATSASQANTDVPNPCPLTVSSVAAAVGQAFGGGPVNLGSPDQWASGCQYHLGNGDDLAIKVIPYAANVFNTLGVRGVEARYGGSSAQQVVSSTAAAFQAIAKASPQFNSFAQYPDLGAGLVTNGMGTFVLAGTHDYWYRGAFGNITASPIYNEPAVNVAKALAAQ
jgi:hypothetical protein